MGRRYWAAQVVARYGGDILRAPQMQLEKECLQHGTVTVFQHSLAVAVTCVTIASILRLRVDQRALVRGALLHDYFLYDWHIPGSHQGLHGFTHAQIALRNAERDFQLGRIERDMIAKHMFPLNPVPPHCWESAVICVADKLCAAQETLSPSRFRCK